MSKNMNPSLEKLKGKLFSTNYSLWRNIVSTSFLGIACLGMVGSFIYLYLNHSGLSCYKGFLVFSIIWLIAELIAITYLFLWSNIPAFARDAVKINIAFANVWFGLFIFGLNACVE